MLLDLLRTQKGRLTNEAGFLQAGCSGSGSGPDALFISAVHVQFLARVQRASGTALTAPRMPGRSSRHWSRS